MLCMLPQLLLMLFMLPQSLPTQPLPIMPQLLLLQLIMHLLRLMLMRFLPTPTPTLLLMTTQRPPSMLRRPLMVPAMSRDLTELLFLMAESKLLPTPPMDMMDMLLMSPMRELLPTQRLPQWLLMLSLLLQWLLPTLSMPQLPTPQCLPLLPQLTMVPTSQSTDMAMVKSAINLSASHTRENTDPPPRARPLDPTPLLSLMPPTDFTEPRESLLMLSMPQLLPMLLPQLLFLVKPTNHLVD